MITPRPVVAPFGSPGRSGEHPGRQALSTALAARYVEGVPLRQLVRQSGLSYTMVRDRVLEQRVPMRPRGGVPAQHSRPDLARPRLRIGYSMWGFLACGPVGAPDGSCGYRRDVIDAIQAGEHPVVLLQDNRDLREAGIDLRDQFRFDDSFPNLDALVVEWRWPLPGRNTTVCGSVGHTCDLHRQQALLDYYTRGRRTPTVIWDLDAQLPVDDPLRRLPHVQVAEPALAPTPGALTVTYPVPDADLDHANPAQLTAQPRRIPLVYLGDQRDQAAAFERYFAPAATEFDHLVAGNWTSGLWPHVTFIGRRRFDAVAEIYADALATVLLLPDRYAAVGHQTSQLFDAVLQGCLPLTPADTAFADRFTPAELHVADGVEVIDRLHWLHRIQGTWEHRYLITACLLHLHRYRLTTQIGALLSAVHALSRASDNR